MLSARRWYWTLLLSALLPSISLTECQAASTWWDWQTGISDYHYRETPLFSPQPQDTQWQSSLSLDLNQREWRAIANLHHNRSLTSGDTSSAATLTALYWQHGFAAAPDWELTLGKMQLDWGVGYGYRPLDIFSNYQRHPVGIQVEEGAALAMLTQFVDNGSWQWLLSRSHYSSLDPSTTQQGIGARRYWLDGANEWQALLYWDKQRQWLAGASAVTVVGDSVELHASALYQQRYWSVSAPEFTEPTVASLHSKQHSLQALMGFTWANSNGVQLIGEYWFDSRSWQKQQWQHTLEFATQWQNTAVQGMAHSYTQGFNQANIMRHSMLLHLMLSNRFWQDMSVSLNDVSASVDLLFGPEDGGQVLTPRCHYQLLDSASVSLQISLSWRYYGGRASSAFANLGDNSMTWLGLTGRF
jgi:hypothetical protein